MKRFSQFAIITLAVGAMAVAQAPAPPAPAAPAAPKAMPAPRVPAVPATPATPAVPPVPPASSKHYSYLGVTVRDISPERVSALKLKDDHGVEVVLVDSDSPAGKAGLREHDVVLTFNGRTLESPEEFRKLIRETPPDQTVELGISRDGQRITVKPQLADRQKIVYVAPKIKTKMYGMPEMPIITTLSSRNGVVVENLTPQLGEVFGVKDGAGVLVRSVEKGSAGETAGLRAGDVIVRVGSERVANTRDWSRVMRSQKPGPVQLGIMRDKRQQNLSFNLPEHSRDQMIVIPGKAFAHNMENFGDDMEDMTIDLHDLQPEIDRAMRDQQEKVQRELERAQREIERAMREQERARDRAERDRERAQERAQAEAERQNERAREQAERAREKAQEQAEREREKALQQAEQAREQAERAREQAEEQAERAREQAERDRAQQQQQQNPTPPKPPQQ